MQKKLTITIDEQVYHALHKVIGARRISKFVEDLVRPHVTQPNLQLAYEEMARDEAREREAEEWTEVMIGDVSDDAR